MKVWIIFFSIFFLFSVYSSGQTNTLPNYDKIQNASSNVQKAEIYREFVQNNRFTKPDLALKYAKDGFNYFTQNNDKFGQAVLLSLMAILDEDNGNPELAKKRFLMAFSLFKECKNLKNLAVTSVHLGSIETKTGNYVSANNYYAEALKIYKEIKNNAGITENYIKLGDVNEYLNNYDTALAYYDSVIRILKYDTLSMQYINIINKIGNVYCKKRDFDKALMYFNKGLLKCEVFKFDTLKSSIYNNIGLMYGLQNNDMKSIEYFNKALKFSNSNNLYEYEIASLKNIAFVVGKTDYPLAVSYLFKALDIIHKKNLTKYEADIYNDLSEISKKQYDFKLALEYSQKRQKLLDSLAGIQKVKEYTYLQEAYELEKSAAKVKQLTYLIHKNTIKRNIIIIIAVCNLIILVILGFSYRKSMLLNRKLTKRTDELTEANEIKGKLFSIIGHDLRGPVGNIPVLLELYEDEDIAIEEKQYFYNSIKELAISCKQTLDKMLFWGKSNIKGIKLDQHVIETKEHINNCIGLIRAGASLKNIKLTDNTPIDLKINADPEHFEFIVRNLLSNAIKFTFKDGKIDISADKNKIPGFITFSIKDTGKGIEINKIPYIFDAINESTMGTAKEKGTNLGLKLCKDFIVENGGQIWVESELGKGTVFSFTFKSA